MSKPVWEQDARDITTLLNIMARLRDPDGGCPWDLEQTYRTIAPYTLEEAYEVADAIERHDLNDLREELGDLLLQVVFHARMAEEEGAFSFPDVVSGISEKMIRRHPHVFGNEDAEHADEVRRNWETIKSAEKEAKGKTYDGLLDDIPPLPALTQAVKLQKRAAKVGFDWPSIAPVRDKIREEFEELEAEVTAENSDKTEEEFGDLLFVLANYARHLKVDPDAALRRANQKFRNRFADMERQAAEMRTRLDDLSLDEQEALWTRAKEDEKSQA